MMANNCVELWSIFFCNDLCNKLRQVTIDYYTKRDYYKVTHLLLNLGWVDLDFDCSTVCLILLGLVGIWQKRLSS